MLTVSIHRWNQACFSSYFSFLVATPAGSSTKFSSSHRKPQTKAQYPDPNTRPSMKGSRWKLPLNCRPWLHAKFRIQFCNLAPLHPSKTIPTFLSWQGCRRISSSPCMSLSWAQAHEIELVRHEIKFWWIDFKERRTDVAEELVESRTVTMQRRSGAKERRLIAFSDI